MTPLNDTKADRNKRILEQVRKLTLGDVREHLENVDGLMWIEVNILDPIDVSRKFAEDAEDILFREIDELSIEQTLKDFMG